MRLRSRTRAVAGGAALIVALSATAAGAVASLSASGPGVTVRGADGQTAAAERARTQRARQLGLPPNGPDVLYAPPPRLPQLENRDRRFKAPFELVSGTERYTGREYAYTDFLYDDDATTYPDDFERYAGNAGDLVELRLSARDRGGLAVRFTLNSLTAPDSTMLALAFDRDRDVKTGSSTLPLDPGMPFPGTDHALMTWGTGALWSSWTGTRWHSVPLLTRADTDANQITVTLPRSAEPSGRWRATLATGLHDRSTGGWLALPKETAAGGQALPASPGAASKIINLGFRLNEVLRDPPTSRVGDAGTPSPAAGQDAALAAGEPTRYAHVLDFDLLRRGGARTTVPTHGMMYRIFGSRLEAVMTATDGTPENGNPRLQGEGKDITSLHGRFLSPLQPYALYVPTRYRAGRPAPLTFSLHGDGGQYYWLNESANHAAEQLGEGRDSIVLSPASRGVSGFYVGHHEYDVLEAWNDVARHYTLDPVRTAVTGYSMGGHGSYRLGLLHPHLFARAVPMAPAICRGMWLVTQCTTTEDTVANRWVENARNLPVFHIADVLSELTFYPGQAQQAIGPAANDMQSLDSLGYRYRFWSVAQEHVLMGTNHPEVAEFLGRNEIEPRPFHVTFARMPSSDAADVGLVHDRAYWLSGIQVRQGSDPLAKGVVDAVSHGFGLTDPTSAQSVTPGVTAAGWAYTEHTRTWSAPGRATPRDRIGLRLTNIRALTIDPVAARVSCDVGLDVDSDGPVEITLLGCG